MNNIKHYVQCVSGILGKPKFNRGDKVAIKFNGEMREGMVYIVDSYGTFGQNEEPSYDILVDSKISNEKVLIKHCRESHCYEIKVTEDEVLD